MHYIHGLALNPSEMDRPKVVVELLILMLRIRKIPSSNLGSEIGYLD
jgi:hypothetical protein